jgi:hypothetical protein
MAGTIVADNIQAASTSTLVLKNGVANTPPTIQDSAGTQIGTFCRAWVNFNGTLVTNPASMTGVNGSFNVSSILDNGTGNYTINFATAMPNANYSVVLTGTGNTANTDTRQNIVINGSPAGGASLKSTTQLQILCGVTSSAIINDVAQVNVAIFS